MQYLCRRNLKNRKNMWLAVIIGVCLAVEVLSYLSGGELRLNKKNEEIEPEHERPDMTKAHRNLAA